MPAFAYDPALRPAFLGHMADRLDTIISKQSKQMLKDAGAQTPAHSVSVILYLLKNGEASVAEMARRDGQSHQLITSRIGPLERLGLLTTEKDSNDERRKLCRLTEQGRADAKIVRSITRQIARSLKALIDEIGFDLLDALERAEKSLSRLPLQDR